ncbi:MULTISPECIES: restriction endonuclease subunit S [unclassified Sulfitobacter]|uniref:restriction endonuclease subunit S n=1 Tax=unclassified Sulfitobacter TaxID=196795 RepID=UPI0037463C27
MKASVKQGWVEKPLGEISTLQRGFDLPKRLREPGEFPLVTSSGPTDTHSEAKVKGPGVATGRSGSIGNVFFVEDDFWPLNTALYVKDFHGNDPRFVYHLLNYVNLARFASGAGVPTLNRNDVHGELYRIPANIEEQQRIVAVLDEAFEGLTRARAHAEANLRNARDLFDGQLSAIFGKIESGQKKPLGDVCEFVRGPFGGSLKKAIFKPSGYAVYEQQHAIGDQFEDFRYFIDDAKFAEMERFRVEAGDLIMSCSGTMGKVAIVPEGAPDGIINQALLKLRPGEEMRAEFLKRWMQSDDFQDQLSANTMGVAIKNVASVKTLKTLSVMVPSLEEQHTIVSKSEDAEQQLIAITRSYETKLQDLEDLRQSLLQKAFAGELT